VSAPTPRHTWALVRLAAIMAEIARSQAERGAATKDARQSELTPTPAPAAEGARR